MHNVSVIYAYMHNSHYNSVPVKPESQQKLSLDDIYCNITINMTIKNSGNAIPESCLDIPFSVL